jgi:hypothetical protein
MSPISNVGSANFIVSDLIFRDKRLIHVRQCVILITLSVKQHATKGEVGVLDVAQTKIWS